MVRHEAEVDRPMGYGFNSSDNIYYDYFIPECECNKEFNKVIFTSMNYENLEEEKKLAESHEKKCAEREKENKQIKKRVHFMIMSGVNTFKSLVQYFNTESKDDIEKCLDLLVEEELEV